MPKETATERRAREAHEARIAEEKWQAEKPMRLLKALAKCRPGVSGLQVYVFLEFGRVKYFFRTDDLDEIVGYVDELPEHTMSYIESLISDFEEMQQREKRKLALRTELLSRMTDEEKEALGF